MSATESKKSYSLLGFAELEQYSRYGAWKALVVAFCAFFSSLYMLVKLPLLAPFFPTGAKEIILLIVIGVCVGYAFLIDITMERWHYLTSKAFLAGYVSILWICGHIIFGASRQTVSLSALQLSMFPLLFLFVGGVQDDLREALTWLSVALVATGVLALPFVFWDAATGDAYVIKNIDRTRDLIHLTWFSYEGLRREAGIFESGIALCSHLGLAVLGAIYLVLRRRLRVFCLLMLPALGIGIALTLSRLGMVAMVGGLLVLLGAFRNRRLIQIVGAVSFGVIGLLVLSSLFPNVLQVYGERTLSVFTGGDSAQDARYEAWDTAITTMSESPFGIGIGTAGGKVNPESMVLVPESSFLKLGVELGIASMIAFVAIYGWALRHTLIVAREPHDNVDVRLDLAYLAALVVATLINHAFVQAMEYFSYGPISMIVLGMAINLREVRAVEDVPLDTTRIGAHALDERGKLVDA